MNSSSSVNSIQSSNLISKNFGKINPWDDGRNFIQDVGELEGFLNFVNRSEKILVESKNNFLCIEEENITHDENYNINLLNELNKISKLNFEKLKSLEILYEKYRSESILSKNKNDDLCYDIEYLIEIFEKIEGNKIKLGNLIHNTHLTEGNIIKIKHANKFEFIKLTKSIITQLDSQSISQRNDIELIKLSSNVHPETINKIVRLNF